MISDEFALQLRPVLAAQHDLLRRIRSDVDAAATQLAQVETQAAQLSEMARLMADIEADADLLAHEDVAEFDAEAIKQIYQQRTVSVAAELRGIGYTDWSSFVTSCRAYTAQHAVDPLLPYESFLSNSDLAKLRAESYEAQYKWDVWDYVAVGSCGILAALIDFFLVRIPRSMNYEGRFPQKGSLITEWLRKYDTRENAKDFRDDWFARWARECEQRANVPYDRQHAAFGETVEHIAGMGGRTHRFQSLGHDPVLGFLFGILDILAGTVTGFSYEHLKSKHCWIRGQVQSNVNPIGLIEALLLHLQHLVSDVATPHGLPAPLLTLAQALNVGSFGKKGRTVAELARWMYINGYDLRHFLVGGLGPGLIEMLLRAFIMIRHFAMHGETKFLLGSHPKYRLMLLCSHGVAAAANAGKVALYQGNPLAINEAQWLALGRYLLPTLKYWLFDRDRLKLEHLERLNDAGWDELEQRAVAIVAIVAPREFPLIELGSASAAVGVEAI